MDKLTHLVSPNRVLKPFSGWLRACVTAEKYITFKLVYLDHISV